MAPAHPELLWSVICSGITCGLLAISIGANDVANAFSTSVGSGTLKLRGAISIAFVFEILGALVLGGTVTDAIRSRVLNFAAFADAPYELALGMFSSSVGATAWLAVSTYFGMPVSTTHSIIGALAGFGVASGRVDSVRWLQLLYIVLSWFIVPLVAIAVSALVYIVVQDVILSRSYSFFFMKYFHWVLLSISSLPLAIFIAFENPMAKFEGAYKEWFETNGSNKFACILLILAVLVIISSIVTILITRHRLATGWSYLESSLSADPVVVCPKGVLSGRKGPKSMEINVGKGDKMEVFEIEAKRRCSKSGIDLLLKSELFHGGPESFRSEPGLSEVDVSEDKMPLEQSSVSKLELSKIAKKDVECHVSEETKRSGSHKTQTVFSAMQILGATMVVISHSANDTANAVSPFATVLFLYLHGVKDESLTTPWYILLSGGCCMALGLAVFGYKVVKTVGLNLTRVTPSRGYTIDSVAGCLVLVLSHLGIPLSSTHCTVSSILGVGLIEDPWNDEIGEQDGEWIGFKWFPFLRRISVKNVNFKLYRKIFFTWISTIFFSGITTAMLFVISKFCYNIKLSRA
ncbi:phosphate transporter, putative [Theileria equi strain WA]|uniref:Phosphate transporter n=1 Tax=Theileria equi strain WA TaxID=1537102 RepID=L0AV47_THEEQ|nr:phosphate transporter, putative [Theileria equi strain WA]AFZ79405.1 phosphate transporter, putative [Theileria equi strain WA]|eukprot:XP_004829071.1 phosphate transporter, putative [Theileria equi strain WA]